MTFFNIIAGYGILINIIGFLSMKLDKEKARRHKWRIPEKTLFMIAIIGGSLGSILGMQIFRHKTKHAVFVIGMPFILMVQIVLIWVISSKIIA